MGVPHPVTTTDEILVAIHTELVAIRGLLGGEDSPAAPAGKAAVAITEPATKPTARKRTTAGK